MLDHSYFSEQIIPIADKVLKGERVGQEDCLTLYRQASLPELGVLANAVRERWNGKKVFFNRNFHIEPTNICVNKCKFCSYRREEGQTGSWDLSLDEIFTIAQHYVNKDITEVHVVGGVHPRHAFDYYEKMIGGLHELLPQAHIKAFTAEELWKMAELRGTPVADVLYRLQELGLGSIPGGGAEILDDSVRAVICAQKISSQIWLNVHEQVHSLGMPSNATMLYGHVETFEHRVKHLSQLRDLQDITKGFNAFIPLKYRSANNELGAAGELAVMEDLRNLAICRIFLENVPHIKAYWPMLGKSVSQLALAFGADDLDGTIDDSTKIYSMAGAHDKNPAMSVAELANICRSAGFTPVERDSLYREIKQY
ncbi:MAG: aminofutalosine synthase MqnE [Prevotellaceae bacterium]|jgi:aminodeoxyfutalosine synthase|nr:aminofutalosine synthase MqnE [Prevotellaceae bacterium]